MALISTEELRNRIRVTIPKQAPYQASSQQKDENINSFNGLSRMDLSYGAVEKRILLYETIVGEKVYMHDQYCKNRMVHLLTIWISKRYGM